MVDLYEFWAVIVSLIVVKLCHSIYQWRNPKSNGELPPGSMGYPIIGETFEFMKPHDAIQLPTFVKEKVLRHGPVFRTSLFGGKVIISTDIGLNMEIAKTNHIPGMPKSLARLFGANNLFVNKDTHKHARSLTNQFLGSQALKLRMLQDIDFLVRTHLKEGARKGSLDIKETTSKIIIECLAKKVMGEMEPDAAKELTLCWTFFPREWFGFAWNIPGTGVYRMVKARNRMMKVLKETVLKKRASGEELGDFFKTIFGDTERGVKTISLESATEYIFTLFLLANETTPAVLAATIKLISDHPKVMQELQREHEGIVRDKIEKNEKADLTWEDYKSMTFTQMVINESLRITSTVPTVLRIIDHEFQFEKYDDPLAFNPWRWKGKDLSAIVSRTYIPFGSGSRLCVGAEFVKLKMAIFIHHLSRYRWSMKTETTLLRRFVLILPRGSDVQILEDTKAK
ncbi:cytochrome P450, family 702, subfamily A, polypeptide 6 [Arabidopsis thaliana]|uniref:Cytochrome P450, family 702, subfamily A, polypeptide 6 n=1 Tax=Arabidopsis thaliana TaxID=3702 RepID=A0A1P8B7W6_ARATH|nr:cytochrome P450, family 702, subfamily A, polypeptide 6 [Arabidopsis thaliana]ANM67671.1 cytochrome P450, family 702, subfamily A, polypeptide 6 [Arabidopsis thaliana]|eukprot:NP_001329488.1 cytochrome P450, family 702, subfamily A, polypeptide 6 [Arabidopsis thaliana]